MNFNPCQGKEPVCIADGALVDYFSRDDNSWIPARVVRAEPETGFTMLDYYSASWVVPFPLNVEDRAQLLRPRTKPGSAQLEWMRSVMSEGRIDGVASALFRGHARKDRGGSGGAGASVCARKGGRHKAPAEPEPRLHRDALSRIAAEVDGLLGVCGSLVPLRRELERARGQALALDDFRCLFWEYLCKVHSDYGHMLPYKQAARGDGSLESAYAFQRVLGRGTFGVVKLAVDQRTGVRRAVKIIERGDAWSFTDQVGNEIEKLCLLDHPHIVKLHEYYEGADHISLVMDFCSGGELEKQIRQARRRACHLPDPFVRDVMRQILMAIAHVHARGIVHLDLKTKNIMLMPSKGTLPPDTEAGQTIEVDENQTPHVMVIDLGVAQLFRPGQFREHTPVGTPSTMAPEVWFGEITPKADVFSCGVILFELLSLSQPYKVPGDHAAARAFWKSTPRTYWEWVRHAPEDQQLPLRQMLEFDRRQRATASQCLQLGFLKGAPEQGRSKGHMEQLRIFRRLAGMPERSRIYKSVALQVARVWPSNQNPSIKRLFEELDAFRTGCLDKAQLVASLEERGIKTSHARRAAEAMDMNCDGFIDWTEFVAASIDLGGDALEHTLRRVFDEADGDGDGLLALRDVPNLLPVDSDEHALSEWRSLAGEATSVSWPTFRRHFEECAVAGFRMAEDPLVEDRGSGGAAAANPGGARARATTLPPGARAAGAASQSSPRFLAQAAGQVAEMFHVARSAIWPRPPDPLEDSLKKLAAMGFTDRARCTEVLRRHGNLLGSPVFDELCNDHAP